MQTATTQEFSVSERLTVGVAARLSRYLQVLTQAKKMGRSSISSQDIAEYTHVNATQIRRDLSAFGKFGKRGVAVPASAAQVVADRLIEAGVRIIFNYSEALLSTPSDVIVHSTSPAVELLHALYFYLT